MVILMIDVIMAITAMMMLMISAAILIDTPDPVMTEVKKFVSVQRMTLQLG